MTATVPDNRIKESISEGMQTENLNLARKWFKLLGKKVTELRYNYLTQPHLQHKTVCS